MNRVLKAFVSPHLVHAHFFSSFIKMIHIIKKTYLEENTITHFHTIIPLTYLKYLLKYDKKD